VDLPWQQNKCFSQGLQHYGEAQQVIPIELAGHVSVAGSPLASGSDIAEANAGTEPTHMTERERLVWAMEQCGWVQAKPARLLNLTPRQIGYALSRYNIEVKRL
jgi:Nif-specific regulatory protein